MALDWWWIYSVLQHNGFSRNKKLPVIGRAWLHSLSAVYGYWLGHRLYTGMQMNLFLLSDFYVRRCVFSSRQHLAEVFSGVHWRKWKCDHFQWAVTVSVPLSLCTGAYKLKDSRNTPAFSDQFLPPHPTKNNNKHTHASPSLLAPSLSDAPDLWVADTVGGGGGSNILSTANGHLTIKEDRKQVVAKVGLWGE